MYLKQYVSYHESIYSIFFILLDTCTNGGRLFNKGERIPCIDGSNKCTCISTGTVISTRRGTNKFWLCGAPLP